MKYIILFLLFPFFLFSQTITITHPDGIIVDNFGNKLTQDTIKAGSVKITDGLKEGWYIQNADAIGTYSINGKIVWGKSEPVYQGPSLYPDGWQDSISSKTISKTVPENETPWVTAGTAYPKSNVLTFKPKPVITFQAGKGIKLTNTDTSIIISLDDSVFNEKNVYPDLTVSFSNGWQIQTEWLPYISNSVGCNHNWIDINRSMGDYFIKDFTLGCSKGDVGEDIRYCSKCKDVNYRLFFMGKGEKPFEHIKMFKQ